MRAPILARRFRDFREKGMVKSVTAAIQRSSLIRKANHHAGTKFMPVG